MPEADHGLHRMYRDYWLEGEHLRGEKRQDMLKGRSGGPGGGTVRGQRVNVCSVQKNISVTQ